MSREEQIKWLRRLLKSREDPRGDTEIDVALNMAIKLLEQEPCNDAISRQAVNELVDELARAISDERCCISRGRSTATIMRDIHHLPSVTSQPKMGQWLIKRVRDHDHAICSVCGDDSFLSPEWDALELYKYCPNCGAKMEVQNENSN